MVNTSMKTKAKLFGKLNFRKASSGHGEEGGETKAKRWDSGSAEMFLKLIEHLDNHAVQADGLYRRAGDSSEQIEVMNNFLQHNFSTLSSSSPHSIASVVKRILRDTFEPLITPKAFAFIMSIDTEAEGLLKSTQQCLSMLPSVNRTILKHLLPHLLRVATCETNAITVDHVGGTIGICIVRNSTSDDRDYKEIAKRKAFASTFVARANDLDYETSVDFTNIDHSKVAKAGSKQTWMKKIRSKAPQGENGKQKKRPSLINSSDKLPSISPEAAAKITSLIQYIAKSSTGVEGIYKRLGDNMEQKKLLAFFTSGSLPDLTRYSPYSIVAVVKQVLRDKYAPLLSYECYRIVLSSLSSETELDLSICNVIRGLPLTNRKLLQDMLLQLYIVDKNNMDSDALASSIGFLLIRRSETSDDSDYRAIRCRRIIAKMLIDNARKWPYGCEASIVVPKANKLKAVVRTLLLGRAIQGSMKQTETEAKDLLPGIPADIAKVLQSLVKYIAEEGDNISGLFRLQGKQVHQREIVHLIKGGETPEWSLYSIHSIASALKQLLSGIYAPLIKYDSFKLLSVVKGDRPRLVKSLTVCIEKLPSEQRRLLILLIRTLVQLANSTNNDMTIAHMVSTIGVLLVRRSESNEDRNFEAMEVRKSIAQVLLDGSKTWDEIDEARESESPSAQNPGQSSTTRDSATSIARSSISSTTSRKTESAVLYLDPIPPKIASKVLLCISCLDQQYKQKRLHLRHGIDSQIQALVKALSNLDMKLPDLAQVSPHSISTALSQILQSHYEPLLEYKASNVLLQDAIEESDLPQLLQQRIVQISACNTQILKALLEHLAKFQNREIHIAFAPCFARPPEVTQQYEAHVFEFQTKIAELLVHHASEWKYNQDRASSSSPKRKSTVMELVEESLHKVEIEIEHSESPTKPPIEALKETSPLSVPRAPAEASTSDSAEMQNTSAGPSSTPLVVDAGDRVSPTISTASIPQKQEDLLEKESLEANPTFVLPVDQFSWGIPTFSATACTVTDYFVMQMQLWLQLAPVVKCTTLSPSWNESSATIPEWLMVLHSIFEGYGNKSSNGSISMTIEGFSQFCKDCYLLSEDSDVASVTLPVSQGILQQLFQWTEAHEINFLQFYGLLLELAAHGRKSRKDIDFTRILCLHVFPFAKRNGKSNDTATRIVQPSLMLEFQAYYYQLVHLFYLLADTPTPTSRPSTCDDDDFDATFVLQQIQPDMAISVEKFNTLAQELHIIPTLVSPSQVDGIVREIVVARSTSTCSPGYFSVALEGKSNELASSVLFFPEILECIQRMSKAAFEKNALAEVYATDAERLQVALHIWGFTDPSYVSSLKCMQPSPSRD